MEEKGKSDYINEFVERLLNESLDEQNEIIGRTLMALWDSRRNAVESSKGKIETIDKATAGLKEIIARF